MTHHEYKLVRLTSIIGESGVLPISRSSWWLGIKKGYYPSPIKLGPNTTAWRWCDIQALIENGVDAATFVNDALN